MAKVTDLSQSDISAYLKRIKVARTLGEFKVSDEIRDTLRGHNIRISYERETVVALFYQKKLLVNGVYSPEYQIMRY